MLGVDGRHIRLMMMVIVIVKVIMILVVTMLVIIDSAGWGDATTNQMLV